jgi:hypothetical protein
VKKEQNGRESLRRLKPTVGCNASKRRRKRKRRRRVRSLIVGKNTYVFNTNTNGTIR